MMNGPFILRENSAPSRGGRREVRIFSLARRRRVLVDPDCAGRCNFYPSIRNLCWNCRCWCCRGYARCGSRAEHRSSRRLDAQFHPPKSHWIRSGSGTAVSLDCQRNIGPLGPEDEVCGIGQVETCSNLQERLVVHLERIKCVSRCSNWQLYFPQPGDYMGRCAYPAQVALPAESLPVQRFSRRFFRSAG